MSADTAREYGKTGLGQRISLHNWRQMSSASSRLPALKMAMALSSLPQ